MKTNSTGSGKEPFPSILRYIQDDWKQAPSIKVPKRYSATIAKHLIWEISRLRQLPDPKQQTDHN
jgi:hypothetical protein